LKETDLQNLSYAQFQGVAESLFIEPENEDEMRRLVLVQLARMAVRGDWDGFLTGGGGSGGAPTDAEYVVMSLNGTLTDERVLTAGTGISLTDGGAGSTATISNTGVLAALGGVGITTTTVSGNATITNAGVTSNVAGDGIVLSATTGAVTISAPLLGDLILPEYVTLATDTQLQNERVLTAGTGITLTDAGAGSTVTIAATGGGGGDGLVLPGDEVDNPTTYKYWDVIACPPYGMAGKFTTAKMDGKGIFFPFVASQSGTLTGMKFRVTGAHSGGSLYAGIYSANASNGLPQTLAGYATFSTESVGTVEVTSFSSSITTVRGTTYWIYTNVDAAGTASNATFYAMGSATTAYNMPSLGGPFETPTDSNAGIGFRYNSTTYGVPTTPITTADLETNTPFGGGSSGNPPTILLAWV